MPPFRGMSEKIAAIDMGSNGLRLLICSVESQTHKLTSVLKLRESVRMGQDVFEFGSLSEKTQEDALAALKKFKTIMNSFEVTRYRAVATSAVRDAKNGKELIESISREAQIQVEIIDGNTEAELVAAAVIQSGVSQHAACLLIDIGGGSVELIAIHHGLIAAKASLQIGTVRTLQEAQSQGLNDQQMAIQIASYLGPLKAQIESFEKKLGTRFAFCIGTGGNVEALSKLRSSAKSFLQSHTMTLNELENLLAELEPLTVAERMAQRNLKKDRADVIVIAAHLLRAVMVLSQTERIKVPFVGLKEGLISSLQPRSEMM